MMSPRVLDDPAGDRDVMAVLTQQFVEEVDPRRLSGLARDAYDVLAHAQGRDIDVLAAVRWVNGRRLAQEIAAQHTLDHSGPTWWRQVVDQAYVESQDPHAGVHYLDPADLLDSGDDLTLIRYTALMLVPSKTSADTWAGYDEISAQVRGLEGSGPVPAIDPDPNWDPQTGIYYGAFSVPDRYASAVLAGLRHTPGVMFAEGFGSGIDPHAQIMAAHSQGIVTQDDIFVVMDADERFNELTDIQFDQLLMAASERAASHPADSPVQAVDHVLDELADPTISEAMAAPSPVTGQVWCTQAQVEQARAIETFWAAVKDGRADQVPNPGKKVLVGVDDEPDVGEETYAESPTDRRVEQAAGLGMSLV